MTATAVVLGGIKFLSDHNPIPGALLRPLAANAQVGRGQLVTVSPATGYAALNDGTVADQISAGVGDTAAEMSDVSATAGLAYVRLSERFFYGLPGTGTTTDTFTNADFCTPWYIATENTLGKLTHTGADGTCVKRTMGGLVFGTVDIDGTPLAWGGPIAQALAKSVCINNAKTIAADTFAAAQGTTRAECVLPRTGKFPAKVTQVRVSRAVTATDGDTDYWTFTVNKRTSTTPGTGVSLATKATKTTGGIGAMTAFVYYDLTLTTTDADLDILESDTLTITATAATGSSAAIQLAVEVIGKVG